MHITIDGQWFKDAHGRTLLLRGVNLSGSSKVPTRPDGRTHLREGFFDHRNVSFVGRPFPLKEADEHFSRLKHWGFDFLRFLVTWEAIEHAGPGQYDSEYLDYLVEVVKKAHEHGINLFIDPHQDVWSRFTGGDGAPGWTLEAVGLDMTKFKDTNAAIVHQTYGSPFPNMVWATNYKRFATATMFTLFFAGNDLAPNTKIDGVPVQMYLQSHYLNAIKQVAMRLKDLPNVIGYDTMNEPSAGYIGYAHANEVHYHIRNGITATPFQSMLLAQGRAQVVEMWGMNVLGNRKIGEVTIDPRGTRAWLDGYDCVWRANGVWDYDAQGNPHLLRPFHFKEVNGREVHFPRDYFKEFANAYAQTIREVDEEAIIFIETDALGDDYPPQWGENDAKNIVFAAHWYDGLTLFTRRYVPFAGFDTHTLKVVVGAKRVRQNFVEQVRVYKEKAREYLNNAPVLIGEVGIPYNMNDARAYRSGDFRAQEQAMDASLSALEANLLPYTLWNYTPDNSNEWGDGWNAEDLSIFSRDQQSNPRDINSGGRALNAVLRPYARAVAGTPLRMTFDYQTGVFEFVYKHDPAVSAPTEFYMPAWQYPHGYTVEVSDGTYEIDPAAQTLIYRHSERDMPHFVRVTPSIARPKQAQAEWLTRLAFAGIGVLLLRNLLSGKNKKKAGK